MGAAGALLAGAGARAFERAAIDSGDGQHPRSPPSSSFILMASTIFTLVFPRLDGDRLGREHCSPQLPGGRARFLMLVNLRCSCWRSSSTLRDRLHRGAAGGPHPAFKARPFDPIWFGVMLRGQMQTLQCSAVASACTKSVAPKSIRTADIYWGAIPFLVIQLFMVAVVLAFPRWCCAMRLPTPAASRKSHRRRSRRRLLPAEWR